MLIIDLSGFRCCAYIFTVCFLHYKCFLLQFPLVKEISNFTPLCQTLPSFEFNILSECILNHCDVIVLTISVHRSKQTFKCLRVSSHCSRSFKDNILPWWTMYRHTRTHRHKYTHSKSENHTKITVMAGNETTWLSKVRNKLKEEQHGSWKNRRQFQLSSFMGREWKITHINTLDWIKITDRGR